MNREGLILTFAAAAAPLALWVDSRLIRRSFGWGRVAAHVAIALVVLAAAPRVMAWVFETGESPQRVFAALFAVFLPALVYAFLSALWLFKQAGRVLGIR